MNNQDIVCQLELIRKRIHDCNELDKTTQDSTLKELSDSVAFLKLNIDSANVPGNGKWDKVTVINSMVDVLYHLLSIMDQREVCLDCILRNLLHKLDYQDAKRRKGILSAGDIIVPPPTVINENNTK